MQECVWGSERGPPSGELCVFMVFLLTARHQIMKEKGQAMQSGTPTSNIPLRLLWVVVIVGFAIIAIILLWDRSSNSQQSVAPPQLSLRQHAGLIQYKPTNAEDTDDNWHTITTISALTGKDGQDGQDGKDGTDGQNGTNGTNGLDGTTGQNGTDGLNGTDGQDGTNGTNGTDGREIELQKDLYFIQWRYISEPGWRNLIAYAELKGEKGDKGDDGLSGTPGAQGEQGMQGPKGDKGDPGEDGHTPDFYPRTPSNRWLMPMFAGFVINQVPAPGYVPIRIAREQSWLSMGVEIKTPINGAQVYMALYADDGNGYPGERVTTPGAVDASTSGVKEYVLPDPVILPAGLYWIFGGVSDIGVRLAVTTHVTSSETSGVPASLWHSGPTGSNTTTYQGGYGSPSIIPPAVAPIGMSTNRWLTIVSLRAV